MEIVFSVGAMVNALIGGAMMGLSASILLLFNGRIMGVCGIAHGIFYFQKDNVIWRILFILGMFIGGYSLTQLSIDAFETDLNLIDTSAPSAVEEVTAVVATAVDKVESTGSAVVDAVAGTEQMTIAGIPVKSEVTPNPEYKISLMQFLIAAFLVGFGTSLGTGCTTGHGVCGLSRLSFRGMAATMMFMFAGGLTVYLIRNLL